MKTVVADADNQNVSKLLEPYVQSGALNFLFGSGASFPAIATAGNIEAEIDADLMLGLDEQADKKSFAFLDLQRLVRKFDAGERDFRNRSLGKAGEEVVMRFERARLAAEERPDLASKVRWVAQEDGDGAGYDILSFDRMGRERFVEVKTTLGHRTTPFYLTRNECALAEERPDAFRLVRLYAFAQDRRMFELEPPLSAAVQLSPLTYEARFN